MATSTPDRAAKGLAKPGSRPFAPSAGEEGSSPFDRPPGRSAAAPRRLLLIVAGAVFIGEALIMLALAFLPRLSLVAEGLLDALLVTILILPILSRFLLRPITAEIAVRKQAELTLQSEVVERVAAESRLESSNEELRALTQEERNQRRLAEALTEATVALNSSLDLDEVFDRILEQVQRVVPCRALAVLIVRDDWVLVPRHRDRVEPWQLLDGGFHIDTFPRMRSLAESPRPHLVPDTELDPEWPGIPTLDWIRSVAMAPLVQDGQMFGFLITLSEHPGAFSSEIVRFLVAFATYAAVALDHANIYDAELRARHSAEIMSETSLALTQTLELQTVLDLLLDYMQKLTPYDQGAVALLESESRLVVRARAPLAQAESSEFALPAELEVADHPQLRVLLAGQRGLSSGKRSMPPSWASVQAIPVDTSWLAVPIVAGGRALGLCWLVKYAPNFFSSEHVRLAEAMVGQAAVAVQNAWLFQQIRAGRERLQSLSHRLVQIQETERLHVARELHDDAGQTLASLMLVLGQLERDANDPDKVRAAVREIRQVANSVQEDLHRLAMDLRPASLDHLGLVAALEAICAKLQRQYGLPVQFKAVGWGEARLGTEAEVTLYRVAQEALTNVVRHAHATHIDVLLQQGEQGATLTVEDNGVGFDPERSASESRLGLVGMRERCEMMGGTLVVESSHGAGTTLVAEIPHANPDSDLRRP